MNNLKQFVPRRIPQSDMDTFRRVWSEYAEVIVDEGRCFAVHRAAPEHQGSGREAAGCLRVVSAA